MSRLKDVLAGNTGKIDQNKLNFFLQKNPFPESTAAEKPSSKIYVRYLIYDKVSDACSVPKYTTQSLIPCN